jgi:predicted Zn-dependent peptidase
VRPAGPRRAQRTLPGGLRVVVEERPTAPSVGLRISLAFGAVDDPPDLPGAAQLAWSWQERGAAGLDARTRAERFAALGARLSGAVGRERASLAVRLPAAGWRPALALASDEVVRPDLDDATFAVARQQALDAHDARDARPAEVAFDALLACTFASPHGRPVVGERSALEAATAERIRRHRAARLGGGGGVLALVGPVDAEEALDAVEGAWGGWSVGNGASPPRPRRRFAPPGRHEARLDAEQAQLGWAWPCLPPDHRLAAAGALAITILGDGPGSRLFDEVREARGLAYQVDAALDQAPDAAWAVVTAQATARRADLVVRTVGDQLARLPDGVTEEELAWARLRHRAAEAETAETTSGRAGQLVRDLVLRGRTRSLAERMDAWNGPTRAMVADAVAAAGPERATAYLGRPRGTP